MPSCHLSKVELESSSGKARLPDEKAINCESAMRLDTKYRTLAESLHDTGYVTGHFGKCHLGAEPYSPLRQGFEVDVPHTPGPDPAGGYMAPWKYPDFRTNTPDEHIENRMADGIVTVIAKGSPFLAIAGGRQSGPLTFKMKLLSPDRGEGAIGWAPVEAENEPAVCRVPFSPKAGGWDEISATLPALGPASAFRLHLPAQSGRCRSTGSNCNFAPEPRRWDFDRSAALPEVHQKLEAKGDVGF